MKKLSFALVGAATLALAACNNNQDRVDENTANLEAGAEDLNALAGEAANDAEAEALGNQAAQLNAEAEAAATNEAEDTDTNTADADVAVNGM